MQGHRTLLLGALGRASTPALQYHHHRLLLPLKLGTAPSWRCAATRSDNILFSSFGFSPAGGPLSGNRSIAAAGRWQSTASRRSLPRRSPPRRNQEFSERARNLPATAASSPSSFRGAPPGHVDPGDARPKAAPQKLPKNYVDLPTPELYILLEQTASAGVLPHVEELVAVLVGKRGEKPNLRLYNALVLANMDPLFGSAAMLSSVLDEMRQEKFTLDTVVYHNALKALAVHPDFTVRAEILAGMRNQWISLTEEGWHAVVASYAREGLFEQALEALDAMERDQMTVQDWLCDMLVYLLCQLEEFDDALRLMQRRISLGAATDKSINAWYQLFDHACAALHYEALSFVWGRFVRLVYINPSLGQCMCVLNAAARAGDVELATDVFRVLSERNAVFSCVHYELLIETYINADDLATALSLLCVMSASNFHPSMGSAASIIRYLAGSALRPAEAFEVLQTLSQSRQSLHAPGEASSGGGSMPERAGPPLVVPTVAMNALLQATLLVSGMNAAIDFYKQLHTVCAHGPDVTTFNILIRGCRVAERKDTAMFLVSEMLALGVEPDAITYDRLILVCLTTAGPSGDYEDAFRYYAEMADRKMQPRNGTMKRLVTLCMDRADDRIWAVLADMGASGYAVAKLKKWALSNWTGAPPSPEQLLRIPEDHPDYADCDPRDGE